MSEPEIPATAADQEKLKKIVEKDEKRGRPLEGFWYTLTAALGVFMVVFYMYCAAVPVSTQYFLGLYVAITYVMILLIYPFTLHDPRSYPVKFAIDALLPFTCVAAAVYLGLHFLLGAAGPREAFSGIRPGYLLAGLAVAGGLLANAVYRRKIGFRIPRIGDILLALIALVATGYWILEYAAINYRMGSELPLDTAMCTLGILVGLEVARRALGWSMTLVGVGFLM
ncbi:MAG TPA: hypothetical protein VLT88_02260 [Desulfosarcina sp.]|nr:hypothetical protein [Desulfosarcina sp.]